MHAGPLLVHDAERCRVKHAAAQIARAYEQHRSFVKRTVRRLGVTPSDADDAVQQVFLVVYRRFDEYVEVGLKRAWLFSVSRLVSRNYLRGVRRARARLPPFALALAPDVEELLVREEAKRRVFKFLDELKESERAAFCLANFEGLTAREIASELDMNINTVYTRLRRARILLEKGLAKSS